MNTYLLSSDPSITTECVTLQLPKDIIEWELNCFAPDVVVIASQINEDGYVLVLEGAPTQVLFLLDHWGVN